MQSFSIFPPSAFFDLAFLRDLRPNLITPSSPFLKEKNFYFHSDFFNMLSGLPKSEFRSWMHRAKRCNFHLAKYHSWGNVTFLKCFSTISIQMKWEIYSGSSIHQNIWTFQREDNPYHWFHVLVCAFSSHWQIPRFIF